MLAQTALVQTAAQDGLRSPMTTEERSKWLHANARRIQIEWATKYTNGQLEHDGDLGEVSIEGLLAEMEQEALDQLSYVAEIRRRLGLEPSNLYTYAQPTNPSDRH